MQEQLLTVVLRTDRNGDFQLDEREATILITRMKNFSGIVFDENRVRKSLVTANGSLPALMKIIREIGEESNKEEESKENDTASPTKQRRKLVEIDDRKLLESVRMNYSSSTCTMFNADDETINSNSIRCFDG